MEKTFCSFFKSDFNDIVGHKKFLELDVVLIKEILQKPNFPSWYEKREGNMDIYSLIHCFSENRKTLTNATYAWIKHNIAKRKKYEKFLLATIDQFLALEKKH